MIDQINTCSRCTIARCPLLLLMTQWPYNLRQTQNIFNIWLITVPFVLQRQSIGDKKQFAITLNHNWFSFPCFFLIPFASVTFDLSVYYVNWVNDERPTNGNMKFRYGHYLSCTGIIGVGNFLFLGRIFVNLMTWNRYHIHTPYSVHHTSIQHNKIHNKFSFD